MWQLAASLIWSGHAEDAIPYLEDGIRLSPRDPAIGRWTGFLAQSHMQIGQYDEALIWIKKAHSMAGQNFWSYAMLVCILGHMDRASEAKESLAELFHRKPDFTCKYVEKNYPISDAGYLAHYLDGLRKAGVPEG
jgi:adenylate cyclase